ncbi:MAG TPA: SCO family protein [Acidimicrobiales bacterium]|nr:SCO family protein [Acidimicrobiales bacterium]
MTDDHEASEARAQAPPPETSPPVPARQAGISDEERAAALRAGIAPVPLKFIRWVILGFAILGIGGFVGDKVLGNGSASTPTALAENTGGNNGVPTGTPATTFVPVAPAPSSGPSVPTSMNAFLSLKSLKNAPAPAIGLTQQSGQSWSLRDARGKSLVVTFANAECNDSCSVLASEISDANRDLGKRAKNVIFVVVNSDPLETSLAPTPPLLTETPLNSMPNVTYLTGKLTELSSVWSSYGVTVVVQPSTRTVTHNDIMYFISPTGRLSYRVTPFANEGVNGVFTLPKSDIARFGAGIASVVINMERGS